MRNPDQTKARILAKSGVLFNTRGYKATSIIDITDATGFTKGAIYRHFKSKAVLEKETLFHLSGLMFQALRGKIKEAPDAIEKLRTIFRFFESYISHPVVKGGCPLMNVAIESDDAHPILRKEAVKVLDILHQSVTTILKNGVKFNQLKKDIDIDYYSTVIIAALEGAIMMSKLRGNNHDIKRVVKHLENLLPTIKA
jgi:TetR/AcrR family transcriptional regulator, transcriptional repressor for nem operon